LLDLHPGAQGGAGVRSKIPRTLRNKKLRALIWYQQGGKCALCGLDMPTDDFHLDHIDPFWKTKRFNLHDFQATHSFCNLRKGKGK